MKELDLLKKDWKKNETNFQQISSQEIYKMLHGNSSSVVKWILIISLLEFAFWLSISFLFSNDAYIKTIQKENLVLFFDVLNYINYAVILIFIYFFYKNYKKISVVSSTRQLMSDILKTRKTVNYYVLYNISLFTIGFIGGILMISLSTSILNNAFKTTESSLLFVLVCLGMLLFCVTILWLFYKLLYGFLLKKLHTNYSELKKIDFD